MLYLVAAGLKSSGDKGILHLEGRPWSGLGKRGQCGGKTSLGTLQICLCVCSMVDRGSQKNTNKCFSNCGVGDEEK